MPASGKIFHILDPKKNTLTIVVHSTYWRYYEITAPPYIIMGLCFTNKSFSKNFWWKSIFNFGYFGCQSPYISVMYKTELSLVSNWRFLDELCNDDLFYSITWVIKWVIINIACDINIFNDEKQITSNILNKMEPWETLQSVSLQKL